MGISRLNFLNNKTTQNLTPFTVELMVPSVSYSNNPNKLFLLSSYFIYYSRNPKSKLDTILPASRYKSTDSVAYFS